MEGMEAPLPKPEEEKPPTCPSCGIEVPMEEFKKQLTIGKMYDVVVAESQRRECPGCKKTISSHIKNLMVEMCWIAEELPKNQRPRVAIASPSQAAAIARGLVRSKR